MNMSIVTSEGFTDIVQEMVARGDAFAVATVVRTVSVTAAKPGAKAIVNQHGEIVEGWIGGGCARHAVLKAARQCMNDGQACLVSIKPEELILDAESESDEGIVVARNMCPSKGSMVIFVEPMLSNPTLLVIGDSPVARSIATLAPTFDLQVEWLCQSTSSGDQPQHCVLHQSEDDIAVQHANRYVVIATQGSGDIKGLELALAYQAKHVAFVGSRRKIAFLKEKLRSKGMEENTVARLHGPAGLDIAAVTPQEIALSILAEIVKFRRSQTSNRKSTS